jgi:hypothetical protein
VREIRPSSSRKRGAVPLADAEVGVEVVGQRVPRDDLPAHPRLPALDVRVRGARDERDRGVARVQMGGVGDLIGDPGAPGAAALGPAGDVRPVEEAADGELVAALEEVREGRRPVRALERVVLLHGHSRRPAPFGRERVAGVRQRLLLHQQLLAGGLPLLRRDDRRQIHFGSLLGRGPAVETPVAARTERAMDSRL